MGYGLRGHKELDTAEQVTHTHIKSRLSFERNCSAVFHVVAPCCILISSKWELLVLHILADIWRHRYPVFGLSKQVCHGCGCCLVAQLCPTLCDLTRLLCLWNSPGKNSGVGCHFLLQGIFLTQGLNPGLLHRHVDSLPLSHPGSPRRVAHYFNYDFRMMAVVMCLSIYLLAICISSLVRYLFRSLAHFYFGLFIFLFVVS